MITNEQINDIAERWRIDTFSVVREYIQVSFLSALYSRKESRDVFFKGGTAIHLLFKAPRYSEDLDFSTALRRSEIGALINGAVETLQRSVPGVVFKELNEGEKTFAGQLRYQPSAFKFPLTVHIDVSMRERPFTKGDSVLESNFPIAFHPVIRHLGWEEILAEKVRALTLRAQGRDVYDLWFLLVKGVPLDSKLTNKKLAFYNKVFSLDSLVEKVKKFDEKKLKSDLEKFLPVPERKVVPHLKDGLVRHLLKNL